MLYFSKKIKKNIAILFYLNGKKRTKLKISMAYSLLWVLSTYPNDGQVWWIGGLIGFPLCYSLCPVTLSFHKDL